MLDRYTPVPIGGEIPGDTTAGDSIKIPVSKDENTKAFETKAFPKKVFQIQPP